LEEIDRPAAVPTRARWKPNSSSLGTVHPNPPSRSAANPSTETLIE
jgi:hypothetical protein